MEIIYYYLISINLLGFALMGYDKWRAIRGQWRIEEKKLIGIALVGGGLGIYTGMKVWRHKTQHNLFKWGVPIVLTLQVGAYIFINNI
ncbi:uncharacterized membrane protein YsdA (DUF1294 family) [Desulfitispora alkaliphila]|uniref:DUF1294 domain-containing protein n=1 Tax=Desulfitispora alkaliphila TaxID=622674 RepID=UPI003D1A535D